MNLNKNKLIVILVLTFISLEAFGQTTPTSSASDKITSKQATQNPELWRKKQEAIVEDSLKNLRDLEDSAYSRPEYIPELPLPTLSKEQKRLITVSKEDQALHTGFLKQPKSEIIKLISDFNCGNPMVVNVNDPKCISRENKDLSYYSFRKKFHSSLAWSDLHYQEKQFLVGFDNWTIGIIGEISDFPIDSITKESEPVKALIELPLPKTQNEIYKKKSEIENGINLNGRNFSSRITIENGKTYLLRSYAYQARNSAFNDRRIDIVVAFKVVGIDEKIR
ncbi:MAG: hypothetical protein AAB336_00695, partial [Acidobacteriota bacterium]